MLQLTEASALSQKNSVLALILTAKA